MYQRFRCLAWLLCLCSTVSVFSAPAIYANENRILISGWSVFPPYSYIENIRGTAQWRGLDVELLNEIVERAGYSVNAPHVEWPELVRDIKTGQRHVVATATHTAERETFAAFSVPYRRETAVLIVPRGMSDTLPAGNDAELVDVIKKKKFRLGFVKGGANPSQAMRAFLADPLNKNLIVAIEQADLLKELMIGHIDGYLMDRLVAATFIRDHGVDSEVEEHPVMMSGDIHLMFSKASVPPEVVADFNQAIEEIRSHRAYRELNKKYTFPILSRLTLSSNWFQIVDIIGTIAFSLSGLLLAFRYNYDVFGALVLASLPAVGGGVIRDVITNREELAVLSSPIYVGLVVGLVVGGFVVIRIASALRQSGFGTAAASLFERRRKHIGLSIQVFDAMGLAAFTVTGVLVAVATQSEPLWIWGPILAAITAAGGGILRDVVRSEPEISVLKGEFYPEIALFWGALLSIYMMWQTRQLNADEIVLGIIVTLIGAFLSRLAIIYFKIRSPRFSA